MMGNGNAAGSEEEKVKKEEKKQVKKKEKKQVNKVDRVMEMEPKEVTDAM